MHSFSHPYGILEKRKDQYRLSELLNSENLSNRKYERIGNFHEKHGI